MERVSKDSTSTLHGSSSFGSAPHQIAQTPRKSFPQVKKPGLGEDEDFERFLESVTPTSVKSSSVGLSVRHSPSHDMDKDEEEMVNRRVSFGMNAKSKEEKRMDYPTQKKRRREHDVHDTVFMTGDMETMISKIIKKMMMRKPKSTSTRTSAPGIHIEEVTSSMRVWEASMRALETRIQTIETATVEEMKGDLRQIRDQLKTTNIDEERLNTIKMTHEKFGEWKEEMERKMNSVKQEVDQLRGINKSPRSMQEVAELNDRVGLMKRRVEGIDQEFKRDFERVETEYKEGNAHIAREVQELRNSVNTRINQVCEQIQYEKLGHQKLHGETSNKTKDSLGKIQRQMEVMTRKVEESAKAYEVQVQMQRQEEWLKELDTITDNMKEHFTKDNAKLEEWILQVERRVDQRPHVSVEESKTRRGDEALEEQRVSRMQNLADQVRKTEKTFHQSVGEQQKMQKEVTRVCSEVQAMEKRMQAQVTEITTLVAETVRDHGNKMHEMSVASEDLMARVESQERVATRVLENAQDLMPKMQDLAKECRAAVLTIREQDTRPKETGHQQMFTKENVRKFEEQLHSITENGGKLEKEIQGVQQKLVHVQEVIQSERAEVAQVREQIRKMQRGFSDRFEDNAKRIDSTAQQGQTEMLEIRQRVQGQIQEAQRQMQTSWDLKLTEVQRGMKEQMGSQYEQVLKEFTATGDLHSIRTKLQRVDEMLAQAAASPKHGPSPGIGDTRGADEVRKEFVEVLERRDEHTKWNFDQLKEHIRAGEEELQRNMDLLADKVQQVCTSEGRREVDKEAGWEEHSGRHNQGRHASRNTKRTVQEPPDWWVPGPVEPERASVPGYRQDDDIRWLQTEPYFKDGGFVPTLALDTAAARSGRRTRITPMGVGTGIAFQEVQLPPGTDQHQATAAEPTLLGKEVGPYGDHANSWMDPTTKEIMKKTAKIPSWDGKEETKKEWLKQYGQWRRSHASRYTEHMQCEMLLAALTNDEKRQDDTERFVDEQLGYAQLFEVVTGEKMDDIYTPTREWQDENLPEGPLTSAKFAKWMTSWSRKGKQVPGGVTMEAAKIQMMTELALYVTRNPDDRTMGKAYDRLWQAESESDFSHSYLEVFLTIMPQLRTQERRKKAEGQLLRHLQETQVNWVGRRGSDRVKPERAGRDRTSSSAERRRSFSGGSQKSMTDTRERNRSREHGRDRENSRGRGEHSGSSGYRDRGNSRDKDRGGRYGERRSSTTSKSDRRDGRERSKSPAFTTQRGPSPARSSASTSTRLSKEALDALGKSICYYCKKPGHISKECPQLKDVVCHNCGQKGHQSAYCPQKKRGRSPGRGSKDGRSGSNSSGRSKSAEKRGECHNCGKTGHWAAECPHPKKQ